MVNMVHPETWTDFCQLRWTKKEKVHSRMGKVKFEKFLYENNFPFSKILKKFSTPENIELDDLPEAFVLKPSNLWSARGVMLLSKVGVDMYLNDMNGEKYSSEEIVEELSLMKLEQKNEELPVIIEERVIDEDKNNIIPFDYKLFTFYGEVKFILQVDRNHKKPKIAFFDGNFNPIVDERVFVPKSKEETLGIHRRPKCYLELINLASQLSCKLKSPFISIDCYASKDGPVFGELTHTPGGPWFGAMYRFSDAFDQELGAAWNEASKKLNMEVPLVESQYDICLKGKVVRKVVKDGN